jgi:uncharacterized protein
MKYLIKWVAWILVVIGALNWGLIGFFNFDLVVAIFGSMAYIVYCIVGLSAVVLIIFKLFMHKKRKK